MKHLRTYLMAALIAAVSVSCLNSEEPVVPKVDYNKTYTAKTLSTANIAMGVKGAWYVWSPDKAKIEPFYNRIKGTAKDAGFRAEKGTVEAPQQILSFANQRATLSPPIYPGASTFKHEELGLVLRLTGVDTLTQPVDSDPRPQIIAKLGLVTPQYYKLQSAPAGTTPPYQIRKVPEHYFNIEVDWLGQPGITYYLKTNDGTEYFGKMNNYINENIIDNLSTGDTLLIQVFRVDFN